MISISYGGQEADLPASYQQRQCNEFMKLGMQGVSIVLASGDSGVAGPSGDDNSDGCLGTGQIFSVRIKLETVCLLAFIKKSYFSLVGNFCGQSPFASSSFEYFDSDFQLLFSTSSIVNNN